MISKKIILVLVCLAFLGGFLMINTSEAKATTEMMSTDELQAQINQLLAQLAQLQQQLAAAQGTQPTSWCHSFNANLRIGDSSSEVTALQTALQKGGFLNKVTDDFDEETASAVVAFQEKYANEVLTPYHLLRGTGFVGTATRAKLNKLYGCNTVCAQVITPAKNPAGTQCKNFPTPCDVPTGWVKVDSCTSSSPSITVISPNGGEQLTKGSTAKIQWTYSPLPPDRFAINLLYANQYVAVAHLKYCDSNVYQDDSNPTNFWWNWKTGYDVDGKEIPNGSYRILVYDCGDISDSSNASFSIVSTDTATCTDSDGGQNYYTKGYVMVNGTKSEDECNPGPNTTADTLLEYYCTGNVNEPALGTTYICPNGCQDGACVKEQSCVRNRDCSTLNCVNGTCKLFNCLDGDGGKNYYKKGTVSGGLVDLTDSCLSSSGAYISEGSRLVEYSCPTYEDDDGTDIVTCPNGCKDGVCITSTTTTCTDSDNGKDYSTKGTASNSSMTQIDSCYDPTKGLVSSCSGSNCAMEEYYCGTDGTVYLDLNYKACPNGCSEGKCVTAPIISCIDSDGGSNYNIKGVVTYTGQTNYNPDTLGGNTYTDKCGGGAVNEFYCNNGALSNVSYLCPVACLNGACISSSLTCTDSDGGSNIYVKGKAYNQETSKEDVCTQKTTSGSYTVDSCTSNCAVEEAVCMENGLVGQGPKDCPNGCKDGVCLPASITSCTDSDGGKDYYVKGLTKKGEIPSYTDSCYCPVNGDITNLGACSEGPYVGEWFCNQDNAPEFQGYPNTYTCPNGCKDGACITSTITTCTDSDNGKDYSAKGMVKDGGKEYTDYCTNTSILKEYFCLPSSSTGLGGVAEYDYTCSNGCSNGVCLTTPTFVLCESKVTSNGTVSILSSKSVSSEGECVSAYNSYDNSAQMEINCKNNPSYSNYSLFFNNKLIRSYDCPAVICTDSDNGKDYSTKGTASNSSMTQIDSCYDPTKGLVSSCSGSNCAMEEYYCGTDGTVYLDLNYKACPNGCSEGKCSETGSAEGVGLSDAEKTLASISSAISGLMEQINNLLGR